MLPGPDVTGIADRHRLARRGGPRDVGHEAVGAPVAAADDVSGAHRGQPPELGERAAEGGRDELGASLGCRVGVVAPHRIAFAESPGRAAVLVALVAGHHDGRAQRRHPPRRVQHDRRADGVGLEGADRIVEGGPDEGLRRHVYQEVRGHSGDRAAEVFRVTDVGDAVVHDPFETGRMEDTVGGGGGQGDPNHPGAERMEPQRDPSALEARVSGEKHGSARERAPHDRMLRAGVAIAHVEIALRPDAGDPTLVQSRRRSQ